MQQIGNCMLSVLFCLCILLVLFLFRQVAILCNHQKTVSKAAETMFENLNERLEIMKKQRTDLLE